MNEILKPTMNIIRNISQKSRLTHNRSFGDFLGDRIIQASTETSLIGMIERLAKLMDTDVGEIYGGNISDFLVKASNQDAWPVLKWLRAYPKVAAMLCMLKHEQYDEAVSNIVISDAASDGGSAVPDTPHRINIRMTCLSPLAHGSDCKAGNATIFRRMQVLATNGNVLSLPYYAGNAIRGQMRDLLADDFLRQVGIAPRRDRPPVALWFFHALYAGGALSENSDAEKALKGKLGGFGAAKAQGIYDFRNYLPNLSVLGCALGNRILNGRVRFSDFRPECRQWGNGHVDSGDLFEWLYLTRREDHEDHEEHHGMIANTETLKAGTILVGGIDDEMHATPIEKSAIGRGLQLLRERGHIGADNRRGFGRVDIVIDNMPDPSAYLEFLQADRDKILSYLKSIDAISEGIDAHDRPDSAARPDDVF